MLWGFECRRKIAKDEIISERSVCRGYRCALSRSLWLLSLQVERVIHTSARRAARSAVSQLYKYTAHAKFDAVGALLSK